MAKAACPSDWALERHLLDELPTSLSTVRDHVAACDRCQAKVAGKSDDTAAFFGSPAADRVRRAIAPEVVPREARDRAANAAIVRRAVLSRARLAVFLTAALAGALMLVVMRRDRVPPLSDLRGEEQTVLRVQREWMEAVRDDDDAALDRILVDDYTYTDSRGAVTTKADSLRLARAKRSGMTSFHTSDTKTSIHGDLAVITGHLTVEGINRGKPYAADIRFTDILARIDGQWRAVAAHASRSSDSVKSE